MENPGLDPVEALERRPAIAAEDIVWAFVVSAIVLGLTPVIFVYALLVA